MRGNGWGTDGLRVSRGEKRSESVHGRPFLPNRSDSNESNGGWYGTTPEERPLLQRPAGGCVQKTSVVQRACIPPGLSGSRASHLLRPHARDELRSRSVLSRPVREGAEGRHAPRRQDCWRRI